MISLENRRDQNIDNRENRFRDDEYYASKEFDLQNIEVPTLSVANWGGISLHLRGNVVGYMFAGAKYKWLRFITGRHDLPFYYPEEVELQRSFLDAFLRGDDYGGWTKGAIAPVSVCLRKGDVGYNNPEGEKKFGRRDETEWPIARTNYTKYYAHKDKTLTTSPDKEQGTLSYKALGRLDNQQLIQFETPAFDAETEVTGHLLAHVNVSLDKGTGPASSVGERDIDVFVTLRHISPAGNEVYYTGSSGDNVPLAKGWLRVSLRKIASDHPRHREYLPHREYRSTDVEPVREDEVYPVDVELWPTNVVVEKGGKLILEISSGDTQGAGLFQHNNDVDR